MLQQCATSTTACAIRPRKALQDKSDSTLPFPFKLHQLLEEAEGCGADHVISWLPSGEAFKIHDPEAFLNSVMTKYFKMTKIKSFTRQLVGRICCMGLAISRRLLTHLTCRSSFLVLQYIYGFTKISKGPNMGGFFHPEFRREDQKACMTLSRRDGKEDRRVKANKPKMMEDLQRNLARGRAMSCVGITVKLDESTGGLPSVRNARIPQSLLKSFPTSLSYDGITNQKMTERTGRPKRAFSLFDQTFGDDLALDDFFASPTLGPISALETKALPAPPCSLRIDFSKQPLPRLSLQRFPDEMKSVDNSFWRAPQLVNSNASNDPFQVEPRSIEEMLQTFQEEGVSPFPTNSIFGSENFAENHLQMMET